MDYGFKRARVDCRSPIISIIQGVQNKRAAPKTTEKNGAQNTRLRCSRSLQVARQTPSESTAEEFPRRPRERSGLAALPVGVKVGVMLGKDGLSELAAGELDDERHRSAYMPPGQGGGRVLTAARIRFP